ncbi:hypothetical protein MKW92_047305 [Papaver armeniacum]|nr:hypothetical protein MKW92_047305 [Papaver armeniacum]
MDNRSGGGSSEVSSSSRVSDCEDILREILSRLPVKSLMRFKCVSKHWQFSICQDQGLIDLHFTRSKQRCSDLFIVVPRHEKVDPFRSRMLSLGLYTSAGAKEYTYQRAFMLANLFESRTLVEKSEQKPFHYTEILIPVNGLICFVNRNIDSVCILNPSTRELTPWIASSFRGNKRYNFTAEMRTYCFGFDPATKQHKVVCIRKVRASETYICEVLTVGENTWRRIDEKPPLFCSSLQVSSVYSNGFIYWGDRYCGIPRYLNVFDVGLEKFKVIKVPTEITEQCKYPRGGLVGSYGPLHSLLEVGGHIGLVHRWTDKVVKLWICEDDDTCNGSYSNWNEVNIELPFRWCGSVKNSRSAYFHGVAGEDRIIIESYPSDFMWRLFNIKNVSLHSYDWKKDTLKEADNGVVSEFASVSLLRPFTESLWPVLKVRSDVTKK